MAVKIIKGDLLNCGADIICHQTNFFGMMGGGVAASIWNQLLDQQDRKEYCSLCRDMRGSLLGSVQMLTHHGKPYVANLFSQMAEPDKLDSLTDYRKLRRCLHEVKMFAKRRGYTVAMPGFLGCGIAGGNWDVRDLARRKYPVTGWIDDRGNEIKARVTHWAVAPKPRKENRHAQSNRNRL